MILNLAKLNKELESFKVEKLEMTTKLKSHEDEKSKFEKDKKDLEEKVCALEKEKADLEEKYKASKKEEAAVVIAVEESVNQKVVQSLAAMGVKEGLVKEEVVAPTTAVETASDIYGKYDKLEGKEKIIYFKANEKMILKGMKAFHFNAPTQSSNYKTV